MPGVYKSRIRDEDEWASFKQVHKRVSSVRCSTVPGSALGIVEATWRKVRSKRCESRLNDVDNRASYRYGINSLLNQIDFQ